MRQKTITYSFVCFSIALVWGCVERPPFGQASPEQGAVNQRGQPPSNSSERIKLPFASIVADVDLEIPQGTTARFAGDGPWPPPMVFDPPVHPLGHIRQLIIEGHDVALADTRLVDGVLETRDFGKIEFLLLGPSQTEARATQAQISRIQTWIKKTRQ